MRNYRVTNDNSKCNERGNNVGSIPTLTPRIIEGGEEDMNCTFCGSAKREIQWRLFSNLIHNQKFYCDVFYIDITKCNVCGERDATRTYDKTIEWEMSQP